LLAPAGSLGAAAQALGAGAGAVYVGLQGWSRGGNRNELDRGELQACIRLAHSIGKKVHLAVNTIAKAPEREELLRLLAGLSADGIDAVILNDVGFLKQVRRDLPRLPITVSIGCGALNADDVLFYQDLGAAAVVLPGTLEPAEIEAIKQRVSIRIELMLHMVDEFIQLGKCWMPSYLHFAAADRPEAARLAGSVKRGGVGSCFRICQQPWAVVKERIEVDRRLFPSRQISRLSEVPAFLDAGVDVIKIQGRSLSPESVGVIVGRYRFAIDSWRSCEPRQWVPAQLPAMWTVQGR
jgi:putative protease